MKRQTVILRTLLLVGIVIAANLVATKLFWRVDFTADRRYTLSQATKDMLDGMNTTVTVNAYFSQDIPPQLLAVRREFEDLLIEYANQSGGNVAYQFTNPNVSEQEEQKAQQAGIQPLIVSVQDRDQAKQLRAYMGAVLEVGDKKEVLPVVQGAGVEYMLTTAIKKLTLTEKPKVGVIQGHGEPTAEQFPQLDNQLSVLYDVQPVLLDSTFVPADYKALLWISPQDTVTPAEFARVDQFLASGKGLMIMASPVGGDWQQGFLNARKHVLFDWLAAKGITLGEQVLIDVQCGQISVQQQQGPFSFNVPVQYPYFPIISQFADHPVSKGLESIFLPLAGNLRISPKEGVQVVELARSSDKSGLVNLPLMADYRKEWKQSDFPEASQTVAAILEGSIVAGGKPARLALISSNNIAINGERQRQQQLPEDNISLVANTIEWMSDDSGLGELRTKAVTNRPLLPVDDATRQVLKYANLLVPVFLIIAYGLIRRRRNAARRAAWMRGEIA